MKLREKKKGDPTIQKFGDMAEDAKWCLLSHTTYITPNVTRLLMEMNSMTNKITKLNMMGRKW